MTHLNIEDCFQTAVKLAKKAGLVIAKNFKLRKNVEMKTSSIDLVTETDKAVEEMVKEGLLTAYPQHKFIGEESVAGGAKCELTDTPTWIVDPVDGTMNFVHSFPYTCISIGLWHHKQPCVAVVYNPILEQMYTAKAGQGAFLNEKRIHASGQRELRKALVMTEVGYRTDEKKRNIVFSNAAKLMTHSHSVRCVGSAALHCCYVASGAADAALSLGLYAWDIAAAVLLVQEAGGVVMDNTGAPHDLLNRRLLCAATPQLAQQLVELLEVFEEERV